MKRFLLFMAITALSSCTIVPNRMFKTPKEYEFAKDTTDKSKLPYYIRVEDQIEMQIFSNDGFKLVDVTSSTLTMGNVDEQLPYVVDEKGDVKLPVIGR